MIVAVVGNGPTAKGSGPAIDACDFVVRIKAFWEYGAEQAGKEIDAWATYGDDGSMYWGQQEVWVTQTPQQVLCNDCADDRIRTICEAADGRCIRWYTEHEWNAAKEQLGADPSTGFVAVAMALRRFPDCTLRIFGFDSTVRDAPNWEDAKMHPGGNVSQHPFLAEKRMIARIDKGEWMGQPTNAKLIWHNRPELGESA